MPIGQQAGSVYVLISGDNSQLIAAFGGSEAAARAAGQNIAAALNQAATGADRTVAAIERLTVVVQQEGAAAALAAQRNLEMAASLGAVSTAAGGAATRIAGVGHAAAGAVPEIAAASGAIRVLEDNMSIRAVERFATGVLGLGPLLQAAFPIVGAIALFEMVSHIVGRMGELTEAEKKAAEETKKLDDEWAHLAATFEQGEVERAALEVGKLSSLKLQQFYEDGVASRDRANLKSLQDEIQKAWAAMKTDRATAALSSNPAVATAQALNPAESVTRWMANQDWEIQADKAKELGGQISVLTEKLKLYDEVTSKVEADRIKQQAASQSGALASRQVEARQAQLEAATSAGATEEEIEAGHQHAIVQSRIDAMKDRIAAGVAAAQEEVRVAQQSEARITADLGANIQQRIALIRAAGSAEELGKTPEELPAIRTATAGKVAALEASEGQKVLEAKQATAAAEDRLDAAIGAAHRERAEQEREASIEDLRISGEEQKAQMVENANEATKAKELAIRDSESRLRTGQLGVEQQGAGAESANATAKLAVERQYASEVTHTRAQEVAYAAQLAGFDEEALQTKVGIAQLELLQATLEESIVPTEQGKLKLAQDRLKVEQAIEAVQQKQYEDQTKLATAQRQSTLGGQIQQRVGAGPGSILDAGNALIANTIGQSVDGISSALGRAVQGGKNLGQIFTQLGRSILGDVVSGIAKVGLQMIITALIGKSVGSSIAAAQVTSAAAVGAANAAAATAAIPIVGPALAPGVAAATFAYIMGFVPLASYDKGGPINEDQIAMVHKGEYVLTADQMAGRSAMPALPIGGGIASSPSLTNSMSVNSASHQFSIGAIHMHGVRDMRDIARRLPDVLKATNPAFSPASN